MRSRWIRPEFWKSEDAGELSHAGRLLFVGLWCMADRRGVVAWKAKRIKAEVFPYDDLTSLDVESMAGEMAGLGMVTLYGDAEGDKWLHITNFEKHQVLSTREKREGTLAGPLPTDQGCEVLNGSGKVGQRLGGVVHGSCMGQGRERYLSILGVTGIREGSVREGMEEAACAASPAELGMEDSGNSGVKAGKLGAIGFVDGVWAGVSGSDLERWGKVAPGVDVSLELERAGAWLVENPKRMKKNLRAFLGNWMRRAGERPQAVAAASRAVGPGQEVPKAWKGYGSKG